MSVMQDTGMIPPSPTNPSSPSVHPHHGQSSPPAFRKHAVPEHSNKPLAGGGEAAREGGRGGGGAYRVPDCPGGEPDRVDE